MSRYKASEKQLTRAELTIPLGSQTFSKSRTQYPVGISPLFLDRGRGSYVWDIDGNRYVDLVNSLASITLGYSNPKIAKAVRNQLKNAVTLSLPGILEAEVAELIVELVPSAEMVRFGKNGTDATSAAIRLARAYTGRDHIAVCGYHGWQDWYIGSTTRNKGVPETVSALTHKFVYNDIGSFRQILAEHSGEIAAVMLEPMNSEWPEKGFLEEIKSECVKAGIVLIFDETITGFRYSKGGAQELFGVIPDLSTFGKGMANGFPLSAVVGRKEIMMEMEEIFFSGTFGGELLSLAAAKTVLEMHISDDICGELARKGFGLASKLDELVKSHGLSDVLRLSGHDSWKFLNWSPKNNFQIETIRTFFMQEIFKRGLLVLGTHNISLSFGAKEEKSVLKTYDEVLGLITKGINSGTLADDLLVPPLKPLFRLR